MSVLPAGNELYSLKGEGRVGCIPLQPVLPWRRPGRDLWYRAPSTVPQPIYPEASEKQHRLRNQTLLCTLQTLGEPQGNFMVLPCYLLYVASISHLLRQNILLYGRNSTAERNIKDVITIQIFSEVIPGREALIIYGEL